MAKPPPPTIVITAIGRIKTWVTRNIPSAKSEFNPPATPKSLQRAEETLEQPIPDELRELLRLHDGVAIAGLLPDADEENGLTFSLCSTSELTRITVATPGLKKSFFPFAADAVGNLQGIDISRKNCIMQFMHEKLKYKKIDTSLGDYLMRVADGIESGQYEIVQNDEARPSRL